MGPTTGQADPGLKSTASNSQIALASSTQGWDVKDKDSELGAAYMAGSGHLGTKLCSVVPQGTTPMGRTETQVSGAKAEEWRCTP